MDYWRNKDIWSRRAKTRTEAMEQLFKTETARASVKLYDSFEESKSDNVPEFVLVDMTSKTAVFKYDGTVLNFASYKEPGGKFLQGAFSQEESLCHVSNLYNILAKQTDYYDYNNKHKNRGLYENRLLYCKNIFFSYGQEDKFGDVITCAAPNRFLLEKYQLFTEEENEKALEERIKLIKFAAEDNNVETLILGAFGCGVFRQVPETVCKIFLDVFGHSSIKTIVFAIPKDSNFYAFEHVMKERNLL